MLYTLSCAKKFKFIISFIHLSTYDYLHSMSCANTQPQCLER